MTQAGRVMQFIGVSEGEDWGVDAFAFWWFGEEVYAIVVELNEIGEEMVSDAGANNGLVKNMEEIGIIFDVDGVEKKYPWKKLEAMWSSIRSVVIKDTRWAKKQHSFQPRSFQHQLEVDD